MKKLVSFIAVTSLLLVRCADMDRKSNSQEVPEKMAANEYKGLGFQPPTEQSVIDYAKKHRKSFEKKGESFKEGMKHARKELSYEADANVVTTLFSTKDNYSKENNEDNVFEIADKLESSKVMPSNIDLDLRFTDNNIGTVKPRYDDKDVTSFGVFKNE